MTTQLATYNLALGYLQVRRLSALTDPGEARRALDDYWNQEVAYCLERKFWNFTYRAVQIDASTSLNPGTGWLGTGLMFAFRIPNDWIRTRRMSSVPTFDPPLLQVAEENGYWYANITPIYVEYNSNDPQYGMNLGAWPASFTDYVALRLAHKACKRVTGSDERLKGPDGIVEEEKRAYKIAAANCAMNEAVGFQPQGSWVRARRGFTTNLPYPGGDAPTGGSLIP